VKPLSRFGLDRRTSNVTIDSGSASPAPDAQSDESNIDGLIYQLGAPQRIKRSGRSEFLLVADALCCLVTVAIARFAGSSLRTGLAVRLLPAVAVWCATLWLLGVYRTRPFEELRLLLGGVAVGVIILDVLVVSKPLSGVRLSLLVACGWVLEVATRQLLRAWRPAAARALRTVIVGMNPESASIAVRLKAPGSRLFPLGYVAAVPAPTSFDSLPVLGSIDLLDDIIVRFGVECLCIAGSSMTGEQVRIAMRAARKHDLDVRVSTLLPTISPARIGLEASEDGVWMTMPRGLTRAQRVIKRAFDIVGASILLIAASPILAAVAIAVRLTSKGPVFYRQARVTEGGRVFRMFKFRTMVRDADEWFKARELDLTVPFFKLKDEGPVTPLGRFLRRTSLDELPQLFDVLRGEMSLVGPRPLPLKQVQAHPELLAARHEVKAGLTGWWQVKGRNQFDPEESVELDLFYIENWSFALDLSILARTIPAMFVKVES